MASSAFHIPGSEANKIICPKCKASLTKHKAGTCLDEWVYNGVLSGNINSGDVPKVSTKKKQLHRFMGIFSKIVIERSDLYKVHLEYNFKVDLQGSSEVTTLYAGYADKKLPLAFCKAALLLAYARPEVAICAPESPTLFGDDTDESDDEEEDNLYSAWCER